MVIKTRPATLEDLLEIQKLNSMLFKKEHKEFDSLLDLNWTFSEAGTKYYQDRITKDDGCVLAAVVDGKIVAYLCGGLIKGEEYRILPITAELENTFVLDDFRSKGIGKQLYNDFINWCKTKNVKKVRVEASALNELAIKFYRNNNFKDYSLVLESDI